MQFDLVHRTDLNNGDDTTEVVSLGSLDDLTDLIEDKSYPIRIAKDHQGVWGTDFFMVVEDGA